MNSARYDALIRVAGPVSRETFDRLLLFEVLFLRWSATINLISHATLPDLWERHILDSAQILPIAGGASRWADLGSGGGFPGAVIAILLADRLESTVELIESNSKKAAFLNAALSQTATGYSVKVIRAEKAVAEFAGPQIVTARAVAPLGRLLALTERWLAAGTKGVFHKGREYRREVDEARDVWDFDLIEHRSAVDPDSVILEISRLRRRP